MSLLADQKGFTKPLLKQLQRLNIFTTQDLLLHLPTKYQDRTRITPIRAVQINQAVVIEGVISDVWHAKSGKTKLLCQFKDETGAISLRFFHLLRFQYQLLKKNTRLRCYGEVRLGPKGLEIMHPEVQVMAQQEKPALTSHLTPVYPTTQGLSQNKLRRLISTTLQLVESTGLGKKIATIEKIMSESVPSYLSALKFVHQPPQSADLQALESRQTAAHKQLIFEELLAHRVSLLTVKKTFQTLSTFRLQDTPSLQAYIDTLPFTLTRAQQRVLSEIKQDLCASKPMMRLLQGDVGSGKTIIALLAMLLTVHNDFQAALLAPTELLAFQHYQVFKRFLQPMKMEVLFLASHLKSAEKKRILKQIQAGTIKIIIGTHALFQEQVAFNRLALVVIDEQHRFGVEQRRLMLKKGSLNACVPHQLVMTATPIPRTLAMSCYADLDSSVIDELPPGRTPIITSIVPNTRREEVIKRIRDACQAGRQVYWVCPFIEESETINCQAAVTTADALQAALPEIKVSLLHGRLTASEREVAMEAFKHNHSQLLVATTIIEVGVDIPNASLMIIENAERLGLAQLHQLRGRVGRGSSQSHCVLLYQAPLSMQAQSRLAVMRETTDGFKIAQRDLEIRGPGEVLGTKQTGSLSFRVADLVRDQALLPEVSKVAEHLCATDQAAAVALIERWQGRRNEYGTI